MGRGRRNFLKKVTPPPPPPPPLQRLSCLSNPCCKPSLKAAKPPERCSGGFFFWGIGKGVLRKKFQYTLFAWNISTLQCVLLQKQSAPEKLENRDSINTKVFEGREEGARGRGEGNFLQKVSPSPDIPFPYFASSTRTGVSFSAGILTVGSRCSWLVSALAGLSAKWKGRKTVPGWRAVAVRRRATMEP